MPRAASFTSIALVASAALLSSTDAHQRVTIPAPTYTIADKGINWAPIAFMEGRYKTGPDLLGFIKSKGGNTLRDFMDNKSLYGLVTRGNPSFECGYTDPNGARQPIPADGLMRSSGYTHEGPCEIWIDDVMVKHGDNCNKEIGAGAAKYKIDWSSCKGDCMLRWYWFGNRFVKNSYSWQVYKACIPIRANGGGGGDDSVPALVPDTTLNEQNSTSDAVGKDDDEAGESSAAPAPVPQPSPIATSPSSKCKTRRS